MQVARLGVSALISKEVLVLVVPDVGVGEVFCVLGLGVEDYRVASHLICLIAHLDLVYRDKFMGLSVVECAVRLHQALALLDVAAASEACHLLCGVEGAVVGVHHSVAIYHLYDVGVDCR